MRFTPPRGNEAGGMRSLRAEPPTIEQSASGWTQADAPAPLKRLPAPIVAPRRRSSSPGADGQRATVTFRMPIEDFVRLHYASRALEETCQTVILDALSVYFDANDIEPAPEEGALEEATRLVNAKKRPKR